MFFKWRRDLREGQFVASRSQTAHLLSEVIRRAPALPAPPSITQSRSCFENVIADAVVRVNVGTDAALL